MLDYMSRVTGQTDRLQEELDECDELLHQADLGMLIYVHAATIYFSSCLILSFCK